MDDMANIREAVENGIVEELLVPTSISCALAQEMMSLDPRAYRVPLSMVAEPVIRKTVPSEMFDAQATRKAIYKRFGHDIIAWATDNDIEDWMGIEWDVWITSIPHAYLRSRAQSLEQSSPDDEFVYDAPDVPEYEADTLLPDILADIDTDALWNETIVEEDKLY